MNPEQMAILKGAMLERNPTERAKALRGLESAQRGEAINAAVANLAGQNCVELSRKDYSTFKRSMGRALRGLPPR